MTTTEDPDLEIHQGGVFSATFLRTLSDGVTPDPFATGTTGVAQARENGPGGTLLATFTVVVSPPDATVVLSLTSTQTAALEVGGAYDIFLLHAGNPAANEFFQGGKVRLLRSVTVI
jgi:hypothetical protein